MHRYARFLAVAYLTAIFFETIANKAGDGKLFQIPGWPLVFLLWYGLIYSITYLLFRNRNYWWPALVWSICGPVVEYFLFHRLNIIIDPIVYGVMFLFPFWVAQRSRRSLAA